MGLKGLFSLIRDYHSLWHNIEMIPERPVKLIIDGRTIANAIYDDCKFDGLCGGQYTEFFEKVFRLFINLRNFGFDILIIMECGKNEPSDGDVFEKRMKRWYEFKRLLRNNEPYTRLPILGYQVFVKVANILNIEVLPTDMETSMVLVGIAKIFNAYVLTNRNETYICDIPGVLALQYLSWESDHLEGKFYKFESFINSTKLKRSFIPLLVLLTSPETYITDRNFIQQVNQTMDTLSSYPIQEGDRAFFRRKFDRALSYSKDFSHDSYMTIFSHFQSQIKPDYHKMLDDCLDLANTKIYDPDKLVQLSAEKPYFGMNYSNTLYGEEGVTIDLLFSLEYSYWGALRLNDQCVFISSRAENFEKESAGLISQHIRSVIYGIICPQKEFIKEHLRTKEPLSHRIDQVRPLTAYKGRDIPFHVSLGEMREEDKIEFLFHCLDFDPSSLSELPEYWYLPVVSVHYWLSRRVGSVTEDTVRLLLLCFLACSNGEDQNIDLVPLDYKHIVINQRIDTVHYISEWEYVVSDLIALKGLLGIKRFIIAPERLYNGQFFFSLLVSEKFRLKVKNYLLENEKITRIYDQMSNIILPPKL